MYLLYESGDNYGEDALSVLPNTQEDIDQMREALVISALGSFANGSADIADVEAATSFDGRATEDDFVRIAKLLSGNTVAFLSDLLPQGHGLDRLRRANELLSGHVIINTDGLDLCEDMTPYEYTEIPECISPEDYFDISLQLQYELVQDEEGTYQLLSDRSHVRVTLYDRDLNSVSMTVLDDDHPVRQQANV